MYLFKNINSFVNIFYKLAASGDSAELKKINISKLKRSRPMQEGEEPSNYYSEINELAKSGPIFSANTISFIEGLSETLVPKNNRKEYLKWLANIVEFSKEAPSEAQLKSITEYLSNNNIKDISSLSVADLLGKSEKWHQDKYYNVKKDTGHYSTKNVVYDFGNEFTIVRVPEEDLKTESEKMQHCVDTYCDSVSDGIDDIFSLRDAKNEPHATISNTWTGGGYEISEIKGKQNKPPIPKYRDMIIQWLSESFPGKYEHNSDFIIMKLQDAPEEEFFSFVARLNNSALHEGMYGTSLAGRARDLFRPNLIPEYMRQIVRVFAAHRLDYLYDLSHGLEAENYVPDYFLEGPGNKELERMMFSMDPTFIKNIKDLSGISEELILASFLSSAQELFDYINIHKMGRDGVYSIHDYTISNMKAYIKQLLNGYNSLSRDSRAQVDYIKNILVDFNNSFSTKSDVKNYMNKTDFPSLDIRTE